MLPVGVKHKYGAAAGLVDTGGRGRLFAEIARQTDDTHRCIGVRNSLQHGKCAIRAAIIAIQDLKIRRRALTEDGSKRVVKGAQTLSLVKNRDDEGKCSMYFR